MAQAGSRLKKWAAMQPSAATSATEVLASTLDELRARMAELSSKTPSLEPVLRCKDGSAELPFDATETKHGTLWRRLRQHGPAPRVGHFEAGVAVAPDASLLGLLSMDDAIATADLSNALYIDTETTGLSRGAGTVAFLIGVAYWQGGRLVSELLFVPDYGQERPVLERLRELAEQHSAYISFNGKAFDMPLLRTRYVMAGLRPLPELPHLDLLPVARRVHRRANGTRRGVRLQELERDCLGLVREGDIPGSEVSAVYNHFVRTGDADGLRAVVDHNEQDVLSMVALVALYGEPLSESRLVPADLSGVARIMGKAGRGEEAMQLADRAVRARSNADTLRARAELAKARRLRDVALADFEKVHDEASDARVRLELAKLYEHHKKDIARALQVLADGVAEKPEAAARRAARLNKKSGL